MCTACDGEVLCWKCAFTGDAHKGYHEKVLVWEDYVRYTVNMAHPIVVGFCYAAFITFLYFHKSKNSIFVLGFVLVRISLCITAGEYYMRIMLMRPSTKPT